MGAARPFLQAGKCGFGRIAAGPRTVGSCRELLAPRASTHADCGREQVHFSGIGGDGDRTSGTRYCGGITNGKGNLLRSRSGRFACDRLHAGVCPRSGPERARSNCPRSNCPCRRSRRPPSSVPVPVVTTPAPPSSHPTRAFGAGSRLAAVGVGACSAPSTPTPSLLEALLVELRVRHRRRRLVARDRRVGHLGGWLLSLGGSSDQESSTADGGTGSPQPNATVRRSREAIAGALRPPKFRSRPVRDGVGRRSVVWLSIDALVPSRPPDPPDAGGVGGFIRPGRAGKEPVQIRRPNRRAATRRGDLPIRAATLRGQKATSIRRETVVVVAPGQTAGSASVQESNLRSGRRGLPRLGPRGAISETSEAVEPPSTGRPAESDPDGRE